MSLFSVLASLFSIFFLSDKQVGKIWRKDNLFRLLLKGEKRGNYGLFGEQLHAYLMKNKLDYIHNSNIYLEDRFIEGVKNGVSFIFNNFHLQILFYIK